MNINIIDYNDHKGNAPDSIGKYIYIKNDHTVTNFTCRPHLLLLGGSSCSHIWVLLCRIIVFRLMMIITVINVYFLIFVIGVLILVLSLPYA